MPGVPSIAGKADPAVVRAVAGIARDVAKLQEHPALKPSAAAASAPFAPTQRALQSLQQQIASLAKRVLALERHTADLTPVSPNTVLSPNGTVGAGSALPTVPLADLAADVATYAAAHPIDLANSCQDTGGTYAFLDGLEAYLNAIDPRVGFNGKRGNTADPSKDALSYYHGNLPPVYGSADVYVIDVIGGHCGPNPTGTWNNVTTSLAAGAWLNTR